MIRRRAFLMQANIEYKARELPMKVTRKPTTLEILSRTPELEFANSPSPHYGLFDEQAEFETSAFNPGIDAGDAQIAASELLILAQQNFTRHLLKVIRQHIGPESLLLIAGGSLQALAQASATQGIPTIWLAPNGLVAEELASLPHFSHYAKDLPSFSETPAVDFIVLEGSFHYLDQLALLSKCRDLLTANGQLLLFGEFLDDDSKIEYSALPNLSSFRHLSRRLGFRLIESVDATTSAKKTLALVQTLLDKNLEEPVAVDAPEPSTVAELQLEFFRTREEFVSGRRCFRFFLVKRETKTKNEWADAEYLDIDAFDSTEIAELFEKSFNIAFNENLWNWKYREGNGKCVAARLSEGGEIVAHYGGVPRAILYFGHSSMAIQPCDVMVHPDMRKQYGKGSLFFEVAATFLEREIGNTVSHLLGFGFPNQKAMNISTRLGLYEKSDDFLELAYAPLAETAALQQLRCDAWDAANPGHIDELNDLWAQMSKGFTDGIIGVRNFDYIKYRYLAHPGSRSKQYRCLVIRDTNSARALAFAVVKEHADGQLLMDLICPVETMKQAIAGLNQELNSAGEGVGLKLWITKSWLDKVCLDDATVNELGIEIPCNSWNPGPASDILAGAWWLTAGDMDFV